MKNRSNRWMKTATLLAGVGFLMGAAATTASAKPVCISSSGSVIMKFPKAKLKPGGVTSLVGVDTTTGDPVTGSAYLTTDGKTSRVQVFVGGTGSGYDSLRYEWHGDATLAGQGTIDGNGDNKSDGARIFYVVDCALYPAP